MTRRHRVLAVDGEPSVLETYKHLLAARGYEIDTAASSDEAVALLAQHTYDTVVGDVAMPGMNGSELLRAVRTRDLDVPVLLITSAATRETAARAVELGAFRYLVKPIDHEELAKSVATAVAMHRLALVKREALDHLGEHSAVGDLAGLEVRFVSALKSLWMAYQPIVSWRTHTVVGYEALMRSFEPALPQPGAMLEAAERLSLLPELGRVIRDQVGKIVPELPAGAAMFVNLHARDLLDETLYAPDALLSRHAGRVVLEMTERASLDGIKDVPVRIARLKAMGFRIALDDLGAGHAGLASFTQLTPDVVKLDMSLVHDVHREPVKKRLVQSFTSLCGELGMQLVAEGIETAAERVALLECGCDHLQGNLFARPGRAFPDVLW